LVCYYINSQLKINNKTINNKTMALTLVTSDLIHSLDYSKLTGTITTWNQDTTGNAATATLAAGATILATARNIGGVSFNGSAAIDLPGVNTAGNQNTSGVAATATLLATARTIGGVSFNGSTSINLPGVNIAGNQDTSGNAGSVTNGVYTVGNQTIGGTKTFSSAATFQLSALTNPSGVDANTVLTIKNNGWSGITMLSSAATGSFLTFGDADAGFRGRIQYLQGSTDAMLFETAASEKMRISSEGDVGIGNTHTGGNGNGGLVVTKVGNGVFANTSQKRVASFYADGGGNNNPGVILGYDNSTSPNGIIAARTQTGSGTLPGLQFFTYNGSSWGPRLTISSGGAATFSGAIDMGLNSLFTSGGYKMFYRNSSVNITYSGTSNWQVNNNADNVALMTVLDGGNVGIGNTNPAVPLDITSNSGANALRIRARTQNDYGFMSFYNNAGTAYWGEIYYTGSATAGSSLNFTVGSGVPKLTISSGGEYSFGTPSGVTYGHGSNDGFHLRTGLELGFGNGNNNRPDFGINATGSGGGASLNIYCGEGSDDIDIQISPGAVMQFNSGGIKFGSSGELLDTYEEGSWVVTLPSSSGASITTFRARYTVVGNVCHFQLYVLLSSIPSNGTDFQISLPITPDSTTNDYTGVSMGYCDTFNTNSWLPITHASVAYIYFHRNDGSAAAITNAQASGLNQIILSGHYYI
jgi:hypothetical protein